MSELQPGLLHQDSDSARTLAEAIGIPLHQIHISDDSGRPVTHTTRQKIIETLLDDPVK